MVRKDGAYLRTERIGEIRRLIERNAPVDKGELIAHIGVTIGLTRRKVEEYLDDLVTSKLVSYDEADDTFSGVEASE